MNKLMISEDLGLVLLTKVGQVKTNSVAWDTNEYGNYSNIFNLYLLEDDMELNRSLYERNLL
jgi:hypothetical protein